MEQRLIDANALLKSSFRITGHWDLGSGKAQNFESIPIVEIETAPTIDTVPVVRCGECKHNPKIAPKNNCPFAYDTEDEEFYTFAMKPTDFCSYGELKNILPPQADREAGKVRTDEC